MGPERRGQRGLAERTVSLRGTVALLAAFAAVWLIWGSTYLAIAWAVEGIPPLLMIGARCLLAGGVLYGWARWRGGPRPSSADWKAALVAGVLLFVTGQAVLAWSETRIPSGVASLLIATEVLFIAMLSWGAGRRAGATPSASRPTRASIAAILVGFTGVGLLVLPGGEESGSLDLLGAGAAVAASLSWSIGVFRAGKRAGIGSGQLAGMQLLAAGGVLAVVSTLLGDPWSVTAAMLTPRAVGAFLYLVVFGSIVAFGAYVWLLDRVGPARLSTHAYVNPLVAVLLGSALNAEPFGPRLVLATTVILGSVALLVRRPRGHAPAEVLEPRPRRAAA